MASNWKSWTGIAFVLAALFLATPFLPWWARIGGAISVVVVGLVLVIAAVKRRNADTIESVGLLPTLPDEPPSDVDSP
jgi:membrane protein implicated in regulation of membrane protease activity